MQSIILPVRGTSGIHRPSWIYPDQVVSMGYQSPHPPQSQLSTQPPRLHKQSQSAAYHILIKCPAPADVPSFVSGEFLVIFDPHAKYLPGINPAQPGLKIKTSHSPLLSQFPDTFKPYQHFGCGFKEHFDATLFRFPLRTPELAAASDVKPTAYTPGDVTALFSNFEKVESVR
jgi:hypothetical protein